MSFCPIKHTIVMVSFAIEQIFEQSLNPTIIGLFFILQRVYINKIFLKLIQIRDQLLGRPEHSKNMGVETFFSLIRRSISQFYQAWISSHGNFPFKRQIIMQPNDYKSSFLPVSTQLIQFNTFVDMGVDTLKSYVAFVILCLICQFQVCACQIYIFLTASKVSDEYFVLHLFQSDQKVLWIHIIIDKPFRVYPLNTIQNLINDEEDCFQSEGPFAIFQKLLEARPQNICNQSTVIVLHSIPIQMRDADAIFNYFVNFCLSFEH